MKVMKTRKLIYLFLIITASGLINYSCKKEENSSAGFTSRQVSQVQNSDSQDAIADKNDQDVDNTLDQLQATNYQNSTAKSVNISGSRTIIIDHPDSTTFPKVITIIYNNYQDSTADESFIKNGEIDVTVSLNSDNKQLVTRTQTFKDYSVTTDSTTLSISGTRSVVRSAVSYRFKRLESLRLLITDNITANLSYAITKTGDTDTLKFTRIVAKTRNTIMHFINEGGDTWRTVSFRNIISRDTVTYSGTVTGINEKGDSYSKTVTATTPLSVILYKGTPVIISGTLEYTVSGTTEAAYTFNYSQDPDHPHKTKITVTDNLTLTTHSFDRIISRKMIRWW